MKPSTERPTPPNMGTSGRGRDADIDRRLECLRIAASEGFAGIKQHGIAVYQPGMTEAEVLARAEKFCDWINKA